MSMYGYGCSDLVGFKEMFSFGSFIPFIFFSHSRFAGILFRRSLQFVLFSFFFTPLIIIRVLFCLFSSSLFSKKKYIMCSIFRCCVKTRGFVLVTKNVNIILFFFSLSNCNRRLHKQVQTFEFVFVVADYT